MADINRISNAADDTAKLVYIADTSAMVDLRQRYPQAVFANVWSNLSALVHEGRFLLHEEVIEELEDADDEIMPWIKANPAARLAIDDTQQMHVTEILRQFPLLVDAKKRKDADPWVIAAAIARADHYATSLFPMDVCILAHEKRNQAKIGDPIARQKLPNVCEHFHVKYVQLIDLFMIEGWHF